MSLLQTPRQFCLGMQEGLVDHSWNSSFPLAAFLNREETRRESEKRMELRDYPGLYCFTRKIQDFSFLMVIAKANKDAAAIMPNPIAPPIEA